MFPSATKIGYVIEVAELRYALKHLLIYIFFQDFKFNKFLIHCIIFNEHCLSTIKTKLNKHHSFNFFARFLPTVILFSETNQWQNCCSLMPSNKTRWLINYLFSRLHVFLYLFVRKLVKLWKIYCPFVFIQIFVHAMNNYMNKGMILKQKKKKKKIVHNTILSSIFKHYFHKRTSWLWFKKLIIIINQWSCF